MRKGAATYCSSGTTACPSSVAVHLRAGWTLGGVQDTYHRFDQAGDQHVGRTVCGLPPSSVEFATLPPMFREESNIICSAISTLFPGIPINLSRIAEYALASVVYHSDFLYQYLPKKHLIFQTNLFRNNELLNSLKQLVVCRNQLPNDKITATGIPPHIALLGQMHHISNQVATTVIPALQSIPSEVI